MNTIEKELAPAPAYGSPEWTAERRSYIGASDVPAIMGVSPYGSAYDVWLAKKQGIVPPQNEAMGMGHLLEPVVAELYQRRFPEVRLEMRGTIPHPKFDWLRATIDRMAITAQGEHPVEIKTTSAYLGENWGEEYSDLMPDHVLVQVQTQLMVLGLAYAHVAVLIGGNDFRAPFIVERDREIQQAILSECELFRTAYLVGDAEPECTGPNLEAHLKRKFATHTDVRLRADADGERWLKELAQAKAAKDVAEEQEKLAKTALMGIIGGNYGVEGVQGKAIWYSTRGRTSIDAKGLIAELNVPEDVVQRFTKQGADFRTFKFSAPKG